MFDFSINGILHSNLINFIIMIAIFAFIAYKMKVKQKIDAAHKGEKQVILNSDSEKEKSIFALKEIKNSIKTLGDEIEKIFNDGKKIIEDLENSVKNEISEIEETFNKNGEKMLSVEEEKAKHQIKIELARKSVEIAEKKLKDALLANRDLHKKIIDNAIKELDEIKIK